MGFIYVITNNINNKQYVGKTILTIEERWKQHKRDSEKLQLQKRPLYNAIQKYGIENFSISQLEECKDSLLNDREIYWINKLNTYHYGYNATKGGDGKILFNHELIAKALKQHPYPSDIAKQFNCSSDTVRNIAKEYNITVKTKGVKNVNAPKIVAQYDLFNKYIQSFNSTVEAAQWLVDNKKATNITCKSHIAECARGKRKTAYGYIWKYI